MTLCHLPQVLEHKSQSSSTRERETPKLRRSRNLFVYESLTVLTMGRHEGRRSVANGDFYLFKT
jgi:hypothetical protein